MGKGILIAGAILIIALIGFVAFRPSSGTGAVITSNAVKDITQTDKQRYAEFEAEVACKLMDSLSGTEEPENFIETTMKVLNEAADKYGYTMSEIEANKAKYEQDLEFQMMARDYAFKKCPEIASELQIDE